MGLRLAVVGLLLPKNRIVKKVRILLVKLSSIGDVVHTLPAAAVIRQALRHARIVWVVERRAGAIIKDSPSIDEIIEIDTRAWRKRAFARATIEEIRRRLAQIKSTG